MYKCVSQLHIFVVRFKMLTLVKNVLPLSPKKRPLRLFFVQPPPLPRLLANQTTMIGTTEVQIFRMTNQTRMIGFFLWTEGVYKNTLMTIISVKA